MSVEEIESIFSELRERRKKDEELPFINGRIIQIDRTENPLQITVGPSEGEFGLLEVYGFTDSIIFNRTGIDPIMLRSALGTTRFTMLVCRHAGDPMLMNLAIDKHRFVQLLNTFFRIRPSKESILDLRGDKEFHALAHFGALDSKLHTNARMSDEELRNTYMISREDLYRDPQPQSPLATTRSERLLPKSQI